MEENDPIETDPTLDSFNAEVRMTNFLKYVNERLHPAHRSNHLAVPWGCDFAYYNAPQNYNDMEKLIAYVNTHNKQNVKLLQSTPNTYIDALKRANVTWAPSYTDMFPYSEHKDEFWSGYYTTRPNSKRFVKDGSAALHASSKLYA